MWAEHEFGGARLGDVRLGKRLVQIVQRQGEAPTKSFPGAAQNDQAAVLCIQDGTDLNFAEHPGCVGLGYIGKNKGSAGTLGLHMHATLVVNGEAQVELRWRIEDWHRVLKSGCKVEYLGHRQGERIERAVTINAVIAWRLTLMTLLGRDTPELPADTLFTEIELAALEDFAQDRRQLPPDNLGRAVLTLAMLGGYLNYKRKQYAVPGHKVMWEGYTRLATITQVVERTRRLNEDSKLYQKMRCE